MSWESGAESCHLDLAEMGAPGWVVDIAAHHGLDVAFSVWQRLGQEAIRIGDQGRVYIPALSGLYRAQRNLFIQTLWQEGCPPKIIRERLQRELHIELSVCTISRIVRAIA